MLVVKFECNDNGLGGFGRSQSWKTRLIIKILCARSSIACTGGRCMSTSASIEWKTHEKTKE